MRISDVWRSAESYEAYIGRWSREVARRFVAQLPVAADGVWVDVGCGSGALTAAIVARGGRVFAVDRSFEYARHTSRSLPAHFATADAVALPFEDSVADAAVSGLVLNFVPKPERAVREMLRCVRPGGVVAVYLWDYAEGMQLIRRFWDAAIAVRAEAAELDEATRFPLCRPAALEALFRDAGASDVEVSAITIPTTFPSFDDLWAPFLGGQGPAPTYVLNLREDERAALREELRRIVPAGGDGSIALTARAWVASARRR